MRLEDRLVLLFKISFPLLILVLLGVSPVSYAVREDLSRFTAGGEVKDAAASAAGLRDAVAREPWRSGLWEQIGILEAQAGRSKEAIGALLEAETHEALTPGGLLLLADVYLRESESTSALAVWNRHLRIYGPSAQVYERMAQLQRSRGDFAGAEETLRSWRAFDSQDARAAYLLGLFLSPNKPDEALPLLIEAAQHDSQYTARVQVLRRGLAQASSSDEQPAYGYLMIGRSLASIGQWDLAREAFGRAVEIAPGYAEAWAFLGVARSQLGGSGRDEMRKAMALDPQSNVVNALYALFLRREGKPADALAHLRAVALKEPEEAAWQIEIANTLVQMGDLIAAKEAYEQAVAVSPKDSYLWQALAQFSVQYSYDVRGLGLPAARQAVLLAPDDPAALDTMGWTLANLGDSASAERFLQQALQNDAAYAPANLHLGQVFLQQQNANEAFFYLKIASGLDENGPTGDVARRLLLRYFNDGG